MTLILTHYSRHGIVFASDSNISFRTLPTQPGRKLFPIPYLDAALGVAGAYAVGALGMDAWMEDFIVRQRAVPGITLEGFSKSLGAALEAQMTEPQKRSKSLIQVGGHVQDETGYHPVMWFVRNVAEILPDGEYGPGLNNFLVDEHFWNGHARENRLWDALLSDDAHYFLYRNGYSPGRIAYNLLLNQLAPYWRHLWSIQEPGWEFRPPRSLKETEAFVAAHLDLIRTVFALTDFKSRPIGGDTQTITLEPPSGLSPHAL